MVFLILIYLVLVALPLPWTEPLVGGGLKLSLLATATLMALPVVAAVLLAHRTRRQLLAAPFNRDEILHVYARNRTRHTFILMAVHGMTLTIFGWGWAVRELCGADRGGTLPFGAELFVMAPFLVALVLSWAAFYPVERTAFEISTAGLDHALPYGGRWSYVVFLVRQHLAFILVPLGLFVFQQGIVRQFPDLFEGGRFHLVIFGVAALALVLAPWFLRIMFRTERLPGGPIRERLEAAALRLRLRYSDILLWNTYGGIANAMVAGPLPWVRYVFLSDRLLDTMPPDEVEAVFGHEAGHVRHGHFLYYLLFILMSLIAIAGLWVAVLSVAFKNFPAAELQASGWEPWLAVPEVALVGSYMFVAFGFLSRRCERQADLFGCRAVSCDDPQCTGHNGQTALTPDGRGLCPTGIRTFIRALDRVAAVNGISRGKPGWLQSWLHSTIARRVAFLEQVIADRSLAVRFQRRVALVKWGLIAGLAAVLVGLALAGFWEQIWAAF
jgi:Zn-dependent protease with chaperone function